METEIWLPIDGFPSYEVSNLGRVRSSNPRGIRPRSPDGILRTYPHKFGYPMLHLYDADRKQRGMTVHSLVCAAFHGPKPTPRHEVAHEDGVPANVSAANLSWKLPVDNHADKIRHGTHLNSGQFRQKLTDADIREIRRLLANGLTQSKIAALCGVGQMTVSMIKRGVKRYSQVM